MKPLHWLRTLSVTSVAVLSTLACSAAYEGDYEQIDDIEDIEQELLSSGNNLGSRNDGFGCAPFDYRCSPGMPNQDLPFGQDDSPKKKPKKKRSIFGDCGIGGNSIECTCDQEDEKSQTNCALAGGEPEYPELIKDPRLRNQHLHL